MRTSTALIPLIVSLAQMTGFLHAAGDSRHGGTARVEVESSYGRLPVHFIPNQGQVDDRIAFYSEGSGYRAFFTQQGIYFSLPGPPGGPGASTESRPAPQQLVRLFALGGNDRSEILAQQPQPGRVNYLLGRDSRDWRTGIPTYRALTYREIYAGVDLRIYGRDGKLEYDVIVKPGSDPASVRLAYEGVEGLSISASGELEVALPAGGALRQDPPVVYQEIDGRRQFVSAAFRLVPEAGHAGPRSAVHAYGFEIGDHDPSHDLIIDPVLIYSTLLGGSGNDHGYGIAVDSTGSSYVTGMTQSVNFPTSDPLQGTFAGPAFDAFVAKLNPAGTSLVYATYLGGTSDDRAYDIAVDASGSAFVTGKTFSSDFPVVSPLQAAKAGGWEIFVARLNASGSGLVFSTYLGGAGADLGEAITLDSSGAPVITGLTDSTDFPLANPIQAILGGQTDSFITKLTPTGAGLVFSTYLGGSGEEWGYDIATDPLGGTYVTGYTESTDFPVATPLQGTLPGSQAAFVTKLEPTGTALAYSTYLGGGSWDYGAAIIVDGLGDAYVAGATASTDFPTSNPFQATKIGFSSDAFVSRINAAGSSLTYSSYLGGTDSDRAEGIAVDGLGRMIVMGTTNSTDFPLNSAYQELPAGLEEVFLTRFGPGGATLHYSTYLGGGGFDHGWGLAIDAAGDVYITGDTQDAFTDFPVQNPIQADNAGGYDAFVTKVNEFNAGPEITVSDSVSPFEDLVLDFGEADPGTLIQGTVTITNDGGGDLEIHEVHQDGVLVAPFGMGSNPCAWVVLEPGTSCTVTVGFRPTTPGEFVDGFEIRSSDVDEPMVWIEVRGSGGPVPTPIVDIKANGSDGPLSLGAAESLVLEVSLDPNGAGGFAADWWLVGETPAGFYCYTLATAWVRCGGPTRFYGGPLFGPLTREVLNTDALPAGNYLFYFGVDMVPNGRLDFDTLQMDQVAVTVP